MKKPASQTPAKRPKKGQRRAKQNPNNDTTKGHAIPGAKRRSAGKGAAVPKDDDEDLDDELVDGRPVGRPRGSAPMLPIYESIGQCAGATGIPLPVLKKAKRAGCQGFRQTRVYLAEVLPFIFSQFGEQDWINFGNKYSALREKTKYEEEQNILILKDPLAKGIKAAEAVLFGGMDRIFLGELPPLCANKDAAGIRDENKKKIEQLKDTFRRDLETALGTKRK